jgi:Xaa-Pro dipeptidase
MLQNKIDAICLAGGTSLDYFGAIRWGGSERLFAMVIPAKGDSFFVSPAFEEDRAREQIALGPGREGSARFGVARGSESLRARRGGLKERSISTGTIGIEETVKFVFSDGIGKALPAMKVASATPVTAGCRMVKTAHELALMRLASQVTFEAYEGGVEESEGGDDAERVRGSGFGRTFAIRDSRAARGAGGREFRAAARFGDATSGARRGRSADRWGCAVEGFQSDISRTFVLGQAYRQNEKGFRHRVQRADGCVESRASRESPARTWMRPRGR